MRGEWTCPVHAAFSSKCSGCCKIKQEAEAKLASVQMKTFKQTVQNAILNEEAAGKRMTLFNLGTGGGSRIIRSAKPLGG